MQWWNKNQYSDDMLRYNIQITETIILICCLTDNSMIFSTHVIIENEKYCFL